MDAIASEGGVAPYRRRPLVRTVRRFERVPPHSTEGEQGVLGCILLSPNECVGESIERFRTGEEVFYDLRHQALYQVLVEMYESRQPIDIIMLHNWLTQKNKLRDVGGLAYVGTLEDTVPSAANLSYYADIVWEKFILRQILQTCTEIIQRVYEHEGDVREIRGHGGVSNFIHNCASGPNSRKDDQGIRSRGSERNGEISHQPRQADRDYHRFC